MPSSLLKSGHQQFFKRGRTVSQGATVSDSAGGPLALVAHISIYATNVTVRMHQNFVLLVPPISHNRPSCQNQALPTPVNVNRLDYFFKNYDPHLRQQIVSGFTSGFSLHYDGTTFPQCSKNLLSAYENPTVVQTKIDKEVNLGRLAGPFSLPPFSKFCISPLGVVPKKTPGDFRLIHHLSFPKGGSINDGISEEFSSVSYATIQDAIRNIMFLGRGCFLAKTDIKSAFRIIPISPKDYNLLGIKWNNLYYFR